MSPQISPFARLMLPRAAATSSSRLTPAVVTTARCDAPAKTVPSQADRSTKSTSSSGIPHGRRAASKVGRPGNFLHLNHQVAAESEQAPSRDDSGRAAAILALSEAKAHPAAAARLAADPGVSLASARAVLRSIAPAAAAHVNAEHGPFVAEMMRTRGLVDGKVHAAAPRDPALAQHDGHNARAQRIEAEGLSAADRGEFSHAWARMSRERAA